MHEQSQENALQTLLAFSALHEHVHQKELLANCRVAEPENVSQNPQFNREQLVLDEVLQLVAERALAITGADGLVIALAENEEIVSRVAAGTIHPDLGVPLDRDSAFSGACFSSAQIWRCDDTETDARVNPQVCRGFGARSIVAVPLCGRLHTIGLLEAFSVEPFGFSDSDVINLRALADLVVGAMNPDEEDWFAASAQLAARKLKLPLSAPDAVPIESLEAGQLEPASAAPALADPLKEEVALPTAIVHQAPLEPEKTSLEFGLADAVERLPESAITAENLDATPPGSRRRIWLLGIVIAAIFAVLAGWRLQMHMGSAPKQGTTLEQGPAISLPLKPRASRMFPQVTGIRHWATVNSSTVVIEVEDQVQYETHRLVGPDRIYVDLHNTKLSSDLAAKSIEVRDPLLKHIRVGQPAVGTTRIVLVTKDHTEFSVRLEPNPYQLVIELKKSGEIIGSH